jgi:hypothetical protein
MFARFRQQGNRLQASLVHTRRGAGRVRARAHRHAWIVDVDVSVRSRVAFWVKLPQRLIALGNRLSADEQPKIYAALHGRIPMVTPDEQRAVQEESFKDQERFWDAMQDLNDAYSEEQKNLIATASAKLKVSERAAADAGERLEAAKDRLQRLQQGGSVSGGLGKKFDSVAAMKASGMTQSTMRRMRLFASLTEAEFSSLLEPERMHQRIAAEDKVTEREARRILRKRT